LLIGLAISLVIATLFSSHDTILGSLAAFCHQETVQKMKIGFSTAFF